MTASSNRYQVREALVPSTTGTRPVGQLKAMAKKILSASVPLSQTLPAIQVGQRCNAPRRTESNSESTSLDRLNSLDIRVAVFVTETDAGLRLTSESIIQGNA